MSLMAVPSDRKYICNSTVPLEVFDKYQMLSSLHSIPNRVLVTMPTLRTMSTTTLAILLYISNNTNEYKLHIRLTLQQSISREWAIMQFQNDNSHIYIPFNRVKSDKDRAILESRGRYTILNYGVRPESYSFQLYPRFLTEVRQDFSFFYSKQNSSRYR